jgi:diguanylate cyclase (GGDEF)-like protein
MIQYAGLGFIMSDRIRYQTKLDGFDNQWVARNQQSLVEYTNLPPGSYNFKVRASYPYGEWHEESAQVDFVITPYYWQKLSFKISMLLLSGLVIFLIFRWRSHLHKLSEAKLKQRIAEQTQDLKQQSQAFEHQATHDQLTGVPNRRAFDKWLIRHFNQATKNQEIMALAIMDIDYFKQVNDKWSHIIGDRVICTIADLLIENAPKNCQISRWGGEEFTIMFPLTNTNTAAAICEELRQKIAQYDFSDIAVGLSITASFGISDSSKATDYDRLLSQADQALYHAKSNGRNQVSTWQPKA